MVDHDPEDKPSLFQRLGGAPVIRGALSGLYQRVLADDKLKPFFVGMSLPTLRVHQFRFLNAFFTDVAFTGDGTDDGDVGRLILEKHRRLFEERALNERSFDRFVGHFVDALKSQQVADELIEEAMGNIRPLRAVFEKGAKVYSKAKKDICLPGFDARSKASTTASITKGSRSTASSKGSGGSPPAFVPKTAREQRLAIFLGEMEEEEEPRLAKPPPRKIEIKRAVSVRDVKTKNRGPTSSPASARSVADQLGGAQVVQDISEDVYERLRADEVLSKMMQGLDATTFKSRLSRFLIFVLSKREAEAFTEGEIDDLQEMLFWEQLGTLHFDNFLSYMLEAISETCSSDRIVKEASMSLTPKLVRSVSLRGGFAKCDLDSSFHTVAKC
jgi:truncated hemoglobin YjbI